MQDGQNSKLFKFTALCISVGTLCANVGAMAASAGPISALIFAYSTLNSIAFMAMFAFNMRLAFFISFILYIPTFFMNAAVFGDRNASMLYLVIYLLGAVVLIRSLYSFLVPLTFHTILTFVWLAQPSFPYIPETELAFLADPIASYFRIRASDPNLSFFHYKDAGQIMTWKYVNYTFLIYGLYFGVIAYKIQLGRARDEIHSLLTNVIPPAIIPRISQHRSAHNVVADGHADVSILMADISKFSELAGENPPEKIVEILNKVFSAFDDAVDQYGLEKIKTIGDGYFAVGGAPDPSPDHLERTLRCAAAMHERLEAMTASGEVPDLSMRIGVHVGPVVAGVIGKRKFSYDLWGDTVNLASRLESTGLEGRIQVSEDVYRRTKDLFRFEERGPIEMKGKGEVTAYLMA